MRYRFRTPNPGRMEVPIEDRVLVEFDGRNGREVKEFKSAIQARSFWIKKDGEGKNPKIKKPQNNQEEK